MFKILLATRQLVYLPFLYTLCTQAMSQEVKRFSLQPQIEYQFEFAEAIQVTWQAQDSEALDIQVYGRLLFVVINFAVKHEYKVFVRSESGRSDYLLQLQADNNPALSSSGKVFVMPSQHLSDTSIERLPTTNLRESSIASLLRSVLFAIYPVLQPEVDNAISSLVQTAIYQDHRHGTHHGTGGGFSKVYVSGISQTLQINCISEKGQYLRACINSSVKRVGTWRHHISALEPRNIQADVYTVTNQQGIWRWRWLKGDWFGGLALSRKTLVAINDVDESQTKRSTGREIEPGIGVLLILVKDVSS